MKAIASNGVEGIITHAIEEMETEFGKKLAPDQVNLAELERRTGVSRAKLRRLQKNGFVFTPHGRERMEISQYTAGRICGLPQRAPESRN